MDVGITFGVVLPVAGVNERLLVRWIVKPWPEGTVITTGDHCVPADAGFVAAHVAVEPPTTVPQKYPHIGTIEPSGSVVEVGAAVRLTCCCPKAATAPARSIPARSTEAFIVDLRFRVRIAFSPLVVTPASSRHLVLRSPFPFRPDGGAASHSLVNCKFPGVHQQHHQHAAGENIVRRDLALVV